MNSTMPTLEALQLLAEQVRGEPLPVTLHWDTRFVEDLGMASVELIGLVFLCEQRFAVDLVNQRGLLATLKTVGVTIEAIENLQATGAPGMVAGGAVTCAQAPSVEHV